MGLKKQLIKLIKYILKYVHAYKTRPLNVIGSPYGLKETIHWGLKHIIVDIYYPFTALLIVMFFFAIGPIDVSWVLISSAIACFFILLFLFRRRQRSKNEINNIGNLNEEGWREFKFDCLDSSKDILNIAFIGDIMRMRDYNLRFEKQLKKFFKGVDLVLGNLEGIITTKKKRINPQNHSQNILKQLQRLKIPPQKWLLCLNNNHTADYDLNEFKKSLVTLQNYHYKFFGTKTIKPKSSPTFKYHNLNILAGTMWSNKKDEGFLTWFKNIDQLYDPKSFNILFPHWHFENECYVRKKIQSRSRNLIIKGIYISDIQAMVKEFLKIFKLYKIIKKLRIYQLLRGKRTIRWTVPKWDLIYGHHTHIPQPITEYRNRLLCYSGGNFTSSQGRKKHRSGLIMKCEIGKLKKSGKFGVGCVDWSYTINKREKKKKKVTVRIDSDRNRKNYYENKGSKFKINLLINVIFLGFWICYFYIIITFNILILIIYLIVCIIGSISGLYYKGRT